MARISELAQGKPISKPQQMFFVPKETFMPLKVL